MLFEMGRDTSELTRPAMEVCMVFVREEGVSLETVFGVYEAWARSESGF